MDRLRHGSATPQDADHTALDGTAMDGTRARALLGLPANPTTDDVRRAFRRAISDAHPDHGGDADRFQEIVEARRAVLAEPPSAPAATAPSRAAKGYADRLRTPPRSTLRIQDVEHTIRTQRPTPTPQPRFEDVLAAALAA